MNRFYVSPDQQRSANDLEIVSNWPDLGSDPNVHTWVLKIKRWEGCPANFL